MHVTAIIAAGGRGLRFGGAVPKQLLSLGGRTILERSVEAFLAHPSIDEVVVALPADLVQDPPPYLLDAAKPLRMVAGGARRQDSVANAFQAAAAASDLFLIHDAARPFVSADLIARTIAAAARSGAAVAALQARDTVKREHSWDPACSRIWSSSCRRRLPRRRSFSRRRRRRSAATCSQRRGARAIRRRGDRRGRAGRARRLRRAGRRRRRGEHQDHDRRAISPSPRDRTQSRSPRGPDGRALATTCIGSSPAGRWCSAASRFRPSAARSGTPTPTWSATR